MSNINKSSFMLLLVATILMVGNVIGFFNGKSISNGGILAVKNQIQKKNRDSDVEKMKAIYDFVINRFDGAGGGQPRYRFSTNYLLFFAGLIEPRFSEIRDPEYLLQQRSVGGCSELSYLMIALAEQLNIHARHVGLNGHVVMEAWYDDGWHMYDPLYQVVPLWGGGVKSVYFLEENPAILRLLYKEKIPDAALFKSTMSMFLSRYDNTYVSYPPLAQFNWKVTVLLHIEQASHYFKWILPLLIFLFVTARNLVFRIVG